MTLDVMNAASRVKIESVSKAKAVAPDDSSAKTPDDHASAKRVRSLYGVMQSIEVPISSYESDCVAKRLSLFQ
jgi:hypothetical protein